MKKNLKVGTKVKLKTFHGAKKSSETETQDFWLLVDSFGKIASDEQKNTQPFQKRV